VRERESTRVYVYEEDLKKEAAVSEDEAHDAATTALRRDAATGSGPRNVNSLASPY
jgi:hypothetical protein